MVSDTEPESATKSCSRCGETKEFDKFMKKRNICKECCNERKKELRRLFVASNDSNQICNTCNLAKPLSCFPKLRKMCNNCNNEKRRNKYHEDETHRQKIIQQATDFKHNKVIERRETKLKEIGENNKKCSTCHQIKSMCNFRHNRLTCKICQRDNPMYKFIRSVRGRIWYSLDKDKHTIEYLGTGSKNYLEWILHNNKNYTLANRGTEWHIDHVIPISTFNLDDKEQQLLAFNWRNTMPLAAKENLQKNCRILLPQIEEHLKHLLEYHKEKKIEMPQQFIDLFAKHLVAGIPLEPSLPLSSGNIGEELG